jgi:hypothetical protein
MNRLAELLFNKSLDECSVEELQHITDKYPYFNAGHLLAATKVQSTDTVESKAIIQKAGLHFHPSQLTSLVNTAGNAVLIKKEITEPTIIQPLVEPVIEKVEEPVIPESEISKPTETVITESEEKIIVPEIQQVPLPEPRENEQPESNASTSLEEQPTFTGTLEETPDTTRLQAVFAESPISKPETNDLPLAFEPFHTVDYFASQGIKVKLEDNSPDKFTRQLKSFTEWLKTMKKLPVTEVATPAINETSEKKIEQLAEVSLADSNVVTEAMAEVWIKQGNTQKAIEIYHKLSLLEPDKSPYFASRISDLKNN